MEIFYRSHFNRNNAKVSLFRKKTNVCLLPITLRAMPFSPLIGRKLLGDKARLITLVHHTIRKMPSNLFKKFFFK